MLYFENFCGETAHAAPSAAYGLVSDGRDSSPIGAVISMVDLPTGVTHRWAEGGTLDQGCVIGVLRYSYPK